MGKYKLLAGVFDGHLDGDDGLRSVPVDECLADGLGRGRARHLQVGVQPGEYASWEVKEAVGVHAQGGEADARSCSVDVVDEVRSP
ncbi:MAG: hypothetical protein IPG46_13475 [Actinobacteria bacterium]|nr:hypothetical protein [Actinomycetota bacterium]